MLLTRQLFLRCLGIVWLLAFLSLWVQVEGLVGTQGIAPAVDLAEIARDRLGDARWWRVPSLFWLWPSDATLHLLCGGGVLLAGLVVADLLVAPALLGCFALYLSLMGISAPFLNFQWDTLLLETTFAATLVAPWNLRRGVGRPPPAAGVWLLRWLLARLMFTSGLVKLTSGDPTWWSLSALEYHYWTQPLPNPVSWYASRLPDAVHALSAAATLGIELALPFAILAGRRGRLAAFAGFSALLLGLMVTGNYGFFQLLALSLCVMLLDDEHVGRLRGAARLVRERLPPIRPLEIPAGLVAAALFALSGLLLAEQVGLGSPGRDVLAAAAPFRVVNRYGLFARMTTERPELLIEGSRDGATWLAYEFRYKADDPAERPPLVAPHMPRLDWQLWFAALSSCDRNPWLHLFLDRLLEGSPAVTGLLARDPFDGEPPRYVRVRKVRFEPGETDWWTIRGEPVPYCPVVAGGSG